MKFNFIIPASFLSLTILSGFEIYQNTEVHRSTGPDFGYSNDAASGFQSCASCHIGAAVRKLDAVISSDIPSTGYVPDSTYNISVAITDKKLTRYGFQISPQNVNGDFLGQLIVTDPITTQLNPENEHYINHTYEGIGFPGGTGNWSFQWIAPKKGSGEVIFYGAFLLSNESNSSSGDIVATNNLIASEDVLTAVNPEAEKNNADMLQIFPNPVSELLHYSVELQKESNLSGIIVESTGKTMHTIPLKNLSAGNYQFNLPVHQLGKGIYHLQLNINEQKIEKSFRID